MGRSGWGEAGEGGAGLRHGRVLDALADGEGLLEAATSLLGLAEGQVRLAAELRGVGFAPGIAALGGGGEVESVAGVLESDAASGPASWTLASGPNSSTRSEPKPQASACVDAGESLVAGTWQVAAPPRKIGCDPMALDRHLHVTASRGPAPHRVQMGRGLLDSDCCTATRARRA